MRATLFLAMGAGLAGPAVAQGIDCPSAQTQLELTDCAVRDYEAADGALNALWGEAMARARALDTGIGADEVSAAATLREAQRAWIPFRDRACEAESLTARGGSLQPMLYYACLARLTRARTDDLAQFASEY